MNFLITGHNDFAFGMQSALKMVAGGLDDVAVIPFLADETVEEYRKKIEVEIKMNERVICFTDLLGGTPYKTCAEYSMIKDQVFVVSGTNLGMLLEGFIMRNIVNEPFEIVKAVIQAGKNNIVLFEKNNEVTEMPEEGI